jgi:predicted phage-related endonuclease
MDILESANPEASDPIQRRTGIGGSDAASILGLNPYASRYSVAVE